jgi:hypothetical protein
MAFFIFLCVFSILINYNFLSYNENFLLCIFFIIFFLLIYILVNKSFKVYNFLKIFKNFYLLLLVLRLNYYFYKLLIYYYIIKNIILSKFKVKIKLIKKNFIFNIKFFFDSFLTVFSLIFFLNLNKHYKLINEAYYLLILKYLDYFRLHDSLSFY